MVQAIKHFIMTDPWSAIFTLVLFAATLVPICYAIKERAGIKNLIKLFIWFFAFYAILYLIAWRIGGLDAITALLDDIYWGIPLFKFNSVFYLIILIVITLLYIFVADKLKSYKR